MIDHPLPPSGMGGILKRILLAVPIIALIAVIIVGVAQVRGNSTPEPTMTKSNAVQPTLGPVIQATTVGSGEDTAQFPAHSSAKAPSTALVLQFELAYNTPDPNTRTSLLTKVATPQYVAANRVVGSNETKGLTVSIDPRVSIVRSSCDATIISCYVISRVDITSMRGGKKVNAFQAPLHATDWINTIKGWRVASEAEVR